MNIFKELFKNLESFLISFTEFDYSNLLLFLIITITVFIIHYIMISYKYKRELNNTKNKFKKINIEATSLSKKSQIKKIYIISFIIISILLISKNNLTFALPILSALIILLILSLREQINNIFLGFLFKSSISTTIYTGMRFYFKETPNEVCQIVKVNLFKSIYKNEKTGKLESIENIELNHKNIIHKVLKELDYIEFKYIVKTDYPLEEYISSLKEKLDENISKNSFNLKDLRKSIFSIKSKYNAIPFIKPFYDINIEYKTKEEIEILISITTYNYKKDNYIKDFMKYRPKVL